MTLEGGKGGSQAPTPDPNIGIAQRELSKLATEQWNTFKTQIYPDLKAATDKQELRLQGAYESTKSISDAQAKRAEESYGLYKTEGLPQLEALRKDAEQYNEGAYQEQMALRAGADVDTASENQRQQMAMRRQQYGIDPTSGVAMGQDNANAVMTAAAKAQAQNQTRTAAHEIGLQKLANVYNAYAGLPAQGNAATSLALGATGQGTAAGQSTVGNATNLSTASNAATQTAMGGWGQVGTLGVQKYNADVGLYSAQQQAESASAGGLGSAIGSLGSAYLMRPGSDIRIKQDIVQVGQLNNGFPLYAFQYKPEFRDVQGHGFRIGVMAQDIEKVIPDAVSIHADGYKIVDYGKVLNHGI
jgi:hypothetical protein